jgi:tricorn protease
MKRWVVFCVVFFFCGAAGASEPIRLANNPALSPQGQWLAFDWNGDIWVVSSDGGEAKPLTAHVGRDSQPKFSPDGENIAFISDREGSPQVFRIPFKGGVPEQLTFHTAGASLQQWLPDGQSLLVKATRDHYWRHGERFFTINAGQRSGEQLLFDDYGSDGDMSPDGTKLLFTREGENWWRKGYQGSRAAQIWLYDLKTKAFTKILHESFGCRSPLWKPDGKGFYYVGEEARGANLCDYDFATKAHKPLTAFKEDSVVAPAISRDGALVVFRHLFDLYIFRSANGEVTKLDIYHNADRIPKKIEQRWLTTATAASFTRDCAEIAFIAGGDLWVMDTVLREPVQITRTPDEESNPVFSRDGQSIYFTSDFGAHFVIAQAKRKDPSRYWWQNKEFILTDVIKLPEAPAKLKLSPDGKKLAYLRGRGDLWVADLEAKKNQLLFAGWNAPDYDWSPDGKWFVCALFDAEFNRDVWILPADGSGRPVNVSRHPYLESNPVWSPDGKMIAFAGRRANGEPGADISFVWLNPEDAEQTARDRKVDKALSKMRTERDPAEFMKKVAPKDEKAKDTPPRQSGPNVAIELERLHERVQRIVLKDGHADALFWSPTSRKLAFTGSYEGKAGTYVIEIGETMTPKLLTTTVGTDPVWRGWKSGRPDEIVWLVNGVPTSTSPTSAVAPVPAAVAAPSAKKSPFSRSLTKGDTAAPDASPGSYTFRVRQTVDLPARNAVVFDTCWRIMRDQWYDARLGNKDWTAVHKKYHDMAAQAPDAESLTTVVQMMLGELNGSHLGFTMNPAKTAATAPPRDVTAHLGVRFDPTFPGPGLKIRDVLPKGPADTARSRLGAGEIVLKIDGIDVSRDMDLTRVLNGPLEREFALVVKGADGNVRDVVLRPISYTAAGALLYDQWLRHNRKLVAAASKGAFGYLHISQMAMPNFRKFEEELVSEGAGKEGLVIDVRENPGGSITDHLLTALTQPVHAITVPRGGPPGYPLDRKVYISWHKPIVVLCNQNSGSNAEIFSHAIKTLKRGPLVGVPTAGAVVSTGAAPILDVGLLRLPTRGWFLLNDGEDMEKNGAVPTHLIWPEPGQLPLGQDAQLAKAIEILGAEVQAWRARPQPKLRWSTERK